MIILVSEICRLILGFLEEEQLFESYNSFLKECKHLNECQLYIRKGIQFSTKIHGKTLRQFLSDYDFNPVKNSQTQTEPIAEQHGLSCQNLKNEIATQTELLINELSLLNGESLPELDTTNTQIELGKDIEKYFDFNQLESAYSRPKNRMKNKRKKKFNNLNKLTTPTKKNTQYDESKSSSDTDTNDSILDIDFFIKNLCNNDFPEQLAKSINQIKTKNKPGNLNDTSIPKNCDEPSTKQSDLKKKLSAFIPKIIPKTNSCSQFSVGQDRKESEMTMDSIERAHLFEPSSSNIQPNEILMVPDKFSQEVSIDLNKNQPEQNNLDENLSKILQNQGVENNLNEGDNFGLFDFDMNINQFSIGNEEISYLADCFSEPAFASLYDAINTNQNIMGKDLNDIGTISEANIEKINDLNSIFKEAEVKEEKENTVTLPQTSESLESHKPKENTVTLLQASERLESYESKENITNLHQTLENVQSNEPEIIEDLPQKTEKCTNQPGSLRISLSENKKSRIIIASSENELVLTENQLKHSLANTGNSSVLTADAPDNQYLDKVATLPINVVVGLPINNLDKNSEGANIIMSPNLTDIGSAMVKNASKVTISEPIDNKSSVNTDQNINPLEKVPIEENSKLFKEADSEKDKDYNKIDDKIELAPTDLPLKNDPKIDENIVKDTITNEATDALNEKPERVEPLKDIIMHTDINEHVNLLLEVGIVQSHRTELQNFNETEIEKSNEKIPSEITTIIKNDSNIVNEDSEPQKESEEKSEKVLFFLDTTDEYPDQSNTTQTPTKNTSASNSKLTINLSPDKIKEVSVSENSKNNLAETQKGSSASLDTSYSAPPTPKLNKQPSSIDLISEDQDDKNLTSQEIDTTWTENDQKTPPPPVTPVKKIGYDTLQAIKQSLLSTSSTKKTSTPSKLTTTPKVERLNEHELKRISFLLEEKTAKDVKNDVSLEEGELDSDAIDLPKTIDQIKEVSKINDFSLSYTSESSSSKNPSPFCTKETFKSAYSGVSSFIKKLEEVNESEKKSSVTSQFNVDEMYSIAQKSFAMSKGTTMKQILESNGKLNDSSSIIFNSENYLEKDVNKSTLKKTEHSDQINPKRKRDHFNFKDDSERTSEIERRPSIDSKNEKRFKYYQHHNYDSDKDNENDYRSYRHSNRYRETSVGKSRSSRASSRLRSIDRGSTSSRHGSRRENESTRAQSCSQRNEYLRKHEHRDYSQNKRP